MSEPARQFADLRSRLISALVLIAVGLGAIIMGGGLFFVVVALAVAVMIWELALMSAPQGKRLGLALGLLASLCLALWLSLWLTLWLAVFSPLASPLILALPALALLATPRRDKGLIALYALLIMIAAAGFLTLRGGGALTFLWLVAVVVASDTMGYFAGRLIGGPKFWPAVSPKKTWSGTVAGWLGAALVGLGFVVWAGFPAQVVVLSPFMAFAGQLGDIAESWLKRRAGVKDSSAMIPGHGGVLDRFDALIGAMLAVQVSAAFTTGSF
jgi:phosphatidate cytidylyltransferase